MFDTITPEAHALLYTIRNSESSLGDNAYTMRYSPRGGATFSDFSKHPRVYENVPWRKDGKKSDAAGAYQFLSSTWNPLAKKYGLDDFSPKNQDKAAWLLAQERYKANTGRDLQESLEAGQIEKVFSALSPTWTSLPSGKEKNKKTSEAFSVYERAKSGLHSTNVNDRDNMIKLADNVDNALTIGGLVTNPFGIFGTVNSGITTMTNTVNELENVGTDPWYYRVGYSLLGTVFLVLGVVKLKV